MAEIGRRARDAAAALALASPGSKSAALREAAERCGLEPPRFCAPTPATSREAEKQGISAALRDRLALDPKRLEAIAAGLEAIAALPDPIGRVLAQWTRPNGLDIERVAVPLGVIGIIYESRPNVTADAGGLALKAGNAAILRGGSESFHSSQALVAALVDGLRSAGLPEAAIQLVPTRDRAAVGLMLGMSEHIDIIVPRGGRSLIERVQKESRIPVIAHLEGICHTYVDGAADPEMARAIVRNAKMRRVSICGATETLLIDRRVGRQSIAGDPRRSASRPAANCAATPAARAIDPCHSAGNRRGLAHRISRRDPVGSCGRRRRRSDRTHQSLRLAPYRRDRDRGREAAAERFLREVDSAIVLVNASTQFADGGEFGMGAEIGISTQRLPPRGPVGAEQLTTYKYLVRGNGQVRP